LFCVHELVVAEEEHERDLLLSDSRVLATVLLVRDLQVHFASQPPHSGARGSGPPSQPPPAPSAAAVEPAGVPSHGLPSSLGETSLSSLSVRQLQQLQVDLPIVAEVLAVATRVTVAESAALNALADYVVVRLAERLFSFFFI
jgi:hypothetical protein